MGVDREGGRGAGVAQGVALPFILLSDPDHAVCEAYGTWQRKLFEVLSPKPDVGFLVDVSSEVAYGRRQEQTPQELADMSELYQEQVPRYRLHRLDGTRPADELVTRTTVEKGHGVLVLGRQLVAVRRAQPRARAAPARVVVVARQPLLLLQHASSGFRWFSRCRKVCRERA